MTTDQTHILKQQPVFWQSHQHNLRPARRQRLLEVSAHRTHHVCLVLQDIHHPHNVSACLRSAEAFGIQRVYVVTKGGSFKPSTVTKGVEKWLSLNRFQDVESCAAALRGGGYKIAAGMPPHKADLTLEEIPVTGPLAILFGNEQEGLSAEWDPHVDFRFTIPMSGFVESLNISVSAAISLQRLTFRAKQQLPERDFYLNEAAKGKLLDQWISDCLLT